MMHTHQLDVMLRNWYMHILKPKKKAVFRYCKCHFSNKHMIDKEQRSRIKFKPRFQCESPNFVTLLLPSPLSNTTLHIAMKQTGSESRQGVNISKVIGWAVFSLRQSAPP